LTLGRKPQLLVVNGSNMSGKSTSRRTVGVNAVLALAGAPVRARRLRISPLAIGATLRVQYSLQRGRSRFYAEITRLRQILDLAKGPVPLLFLFERAALRHQLRGPPGRRPGGPAAATSLRPIVDPRRT
jgi:DNA mismatch repair ATPase MutS